MRDLDLFSLRLFVAVCDAGNMRRAAEQANMVASGVSKRVSQLEAAVGAPLLVRRRHGVVPTAAGETLLQHARNMLMSARLIERDMAGHAQGLQGRVQVIATASVMAEALPDHVADFLKLPEHRNIRIDLEERTSPGVVSGIREGGAAMGICWDAADMGALHTLPYTCDQLCVVLPSGHRLAKRKRLGFADTLDEEHVIMPVQSAVSVLLQRQASQLGKTLRHRVIVTNFDAAIRVVRAGLAIAIAPREVTEPKLHGGGFTAVPLDEPWARRRFVICHRGVDALSPAAGELASYLTARAAEVCA